MFSGHGYHIDFIISYNIVFSYARFLPSLTQSVFCVNMQVHDYMCLKTLDTVNVAGNVI